MKDETELEKIDLVVIKNHCFILWITESGNKGSHNEKKMGRWENKKEEEKSEKWQEWESKEGVKVRWCRGHTERSVPEMRVKIENGGE